MGLKKLNNVGLTKEMLDIVSPENFFVHTGDIGNPIIEMSEKRNLLNVQAQEFALMGYGANIMFAIIYDTETKTMEAKGRIRYNKSGNKSEFTKKSKVKYSDRSYQKLHAEIADTFTKIGKDVKAGITIEGEKVDLEFGIGEEHMSILKKMNDSGHFNIGIPTQMPEQAEEQSAA